MVGSWPWARSHSHSFSPLLSSHLAPFHSHVLTPPPPRSHPLSCSHPLSSLVLTPSLVPTPSLVSLVLAPSGLFLLIAPSVSLFLTGSPLCSLLSPALSPHSHSSFVFFLWWPSWTKTSIKRRRPPLSWCMSGPSPSPIPQPITLSLSLSLSFSCSPSRAGWRRPAAQAGSGP